MTQPPTMLVQRFYVPFLLPGLNDMLAGARQSKGKWQAFAMTKLWDSLVAAGILKDDGWAHVHGFTDEFVLDRAYPGVEVVVEERGGHV